MKMSYMKNILSSFLKRTTLNCQSILKIKFLKQHKKYNPKCNKFILAIGGISPIALRLSENPDAIDQDLIKRKNYKFSDENEEPTGFERVKKLFTYDEYGSASPEVILLSQGAFFSFFAGVVIGGTNECIKTYIEFVKHNKATQFESIFHAQKQLQDRVMLGFIRGGGGYGLKLCLFTSSFLLFTSCISAYRGHSSVADFIGAGAMTGSLFRFKHGPRSTLVGGIVGGVLGTFAGLMTVGMVKLAGYSLDDIKKMQYEEIRQHKEADFEKQRTDRNEDSGRYVAIPENIDLSAVLNVEVEENLKMLSKEKS